MLIASNFMTYLTKAVLLISALVVIVFSIVGGVKAHKIKKKRKERLGYDSLTRVAQVNILKNKCDKFHKLGQVPTGLNDLYQELNRDSATGYAKYLNKLLKKHKKGRKYYTKKNPSANSYASNQIMHSVGVFVKSHEKLFTMSKPNTKKIY